MKLLKYLLGTLLVLPKLAGAAEEIHGPPHPEEIKNIPNCLAKISGSGQKQIDEMKSKLKGIEGLATASTYPQYREQAEEIIKKSLDSFDSPTRHSLYAHYKVEADGLGDKLRMKNFPFEEAKSSSDLITEHYCKLARIELSEDPEALSEVLMADIKSVEQKSKLPHPLFWAEATWPVYGTKVKATVNPSNPAWLKYIKEFHDSFYETSTNDAQFEKLHPVSANSNYTAQISNLLNLEERAALEMLSQSPRLQEALSQEKILPELKVFRDIALAGLPKLPPFVGPVNLGQNLSAKELARYQVGQVIKKDLLTVTQSKNWGDDSYHRFRIYAKTGRRFHETGSVFLLPASSYKVILRNEKSDGSVEIVMEEQ